MGKFCTNCGKETKPGAYVCLNCGAKLKNNGNNNENSNAKSKLVAGLLGIFLGSLGIHNFYLGYNSKGIAQLLISIFGSCIVLGPIVSSIWGLVEGIMILTGNISVDANGVPLKD